MGFWPIFKREMKAFLVSPSTYLVLTIFLLLSGYFFYTDLIKFNWFNVLGKENLMTGLWQYYFNDLRFIMIFVLPLFTMRLFAEEKKLGTMELIKTYPVRDTEIIAGKYLACIAVFGVMLALTLTYVVLIGVIWNFLEIAPVMAGYLGIFLLGCALIACGLFVSSVTDNQVVAAIGTMGFFIFFWFLTWNEMIGSAELIAILKRVSLFDAVFDFFKGVINTRNIIFFLLVAFFFLFLTHRALGSRAVKGVK
ncbi:MAG: ABC transporter permease subunit [Syntrophales bacterium]